MAFLYLKRKIHSASLECVHFVSALNVYSDGYFYQFFFQFSFQSESQSILRKVPDQNKQKYSVNSCNRQMMTQEEQVLLILKFDCHLLSCLRFVLE